MPILRRDHQGGGEALPALPSVADAEVFSSPAGYDAYPPRSILSSLGGWGDVNVLAFGWSPESQALLQRIS